LPPNRRRRGSAGLPKSRHGGADAAVRSERIEQQIRRSGGSQKFKTNRRPEDQNEKITPE
jgi:hypothetical protein